MSSSFVSCVVCGEDMPQLTTAPLLSSNDSSSSSSSSSSVHSTRVEGEALSHFRCEKDTLATHVMCHACFIQYVQHCVESYLSGSVPVVCTSSTCRSPISTSHLHSFLQSHPSLLQQYERACIIYSLSTNNSTEVPLTCTRCNQYTVVLPRDYKRQLIRQLRMHHSLSNTNSSTTSTSKNDKDEKEEDTFIPKSSAPISTSSISVTSRSEVNSTEPFVECQFPLCSSSTCLLCLNTFPTSSLPTHTCPLLTAATCAANDDDEAAVHNVATQEELYDSLIDVLAAASVMRCPSCDKAGQKDEACCCISCDCGTSWCYGCGAEYTDDHFTWDVFADDTHCPQYLNYKWGNKYNGENMFGGSEASHALSLFHLHRQCLAVADFRAKLPSTRQHAFDHMLQSRFPNGIWRRAEVGRLHRHLAFIDRLRRRKLRAQHASTATSTTTAMATAPISSTSTTPATSTPRPRRRHRRRPSRFDPTSSSSAPASSSSSSASSSAASSSSSSDPSLHTTSSKREHEVASSSSLRSSSRRGKVTREVKSGDHDRDEYQQSEEAVVQHGRPRRLVWRIKSSSSSSAS